MYAASPNIMFPHNCIHRQKSEHGIRQGVSPHTLLLFREKHTGLFLSTPPTDYHLLILSTLVVRKAEVESGSFILSRRRPARKKVVRVSFRATNSCSCLITGGKYSVCTATLRGLPMTKVTNSSWNSLPLNPSVTSESFSTPGGKKWQSVIVGVSDLFEDWIVNTLRAGQRPLFAFCGTSVCSSGNSKQ